MHHLQVIPVATWKQDTRVAVNLDGRYLLVTGYSRSISGLVRPEKIATHQHLAAQSLALFQHQETASSVNSISMVSVHLACTTSTNMVAVGL